MPKRQSDPLEKQWERHQNEHCGDCTLNTGVRQDDYNANQACGECREDCENQERDRIEAARDWQDENRFMASRGE